MKLRVVTATRGESPFLAGAMTSIAAAAPGAEQILVCPPARCEDLKRNSPRATVIGETKPGLYAALNQALRAPGEWDAFTWLNDDDRLVAARLDGDIGYGRVELIDGLGTRVGELPVTRRGGDIAALLARGVVPLAQPGTVIRRGVWERLGGFDESYRLAGDLDFFVRAVAAGAQFEFTKASVAAFRLSAGQLSKQRAVGAAEKRRALAPLAAAPRPLRALLRFRLGNLGVYLERVRRHGFVSMQTLYERTQ